MKIKNVTLPNSYLCLEVSVPTPLEAPAAAILELVTSLPVSITAKKSGENSQLSVYLSSRKQADQFKRMFQGAFSGTSRVRIFLLKDWKEKWKKTFHAKKVTPRLWVVPPWEKVRLGPREQKILMEPGMAFGTGIHPTTRFVLRCLDRFSKQARSMVDLGTGTGILAIAAYKLGIRDISALDFDINSIYVARDNFKHNRCRGILLQHMSVSDFKPLRRFDFVGANIETKLLMRAKTKLLGLVAPKGYLALTGIGARSKTQVLKYYLSSKVELVARMHVKGWSGYCLKRI
jgi:ribosomal protein L11 methyltransferase